MQIATGPKGREALAPWRQDPRERTAIRNVRMLLLLRGFILAGGVATATLVPRTMGPATYGRYDLITMLTFWFTMLGGLGTTQVVSRQTPQLEHEGAVERLRALFGNLFALRALTSVAVALLYLLATRLWLRDLEWPVLLVLSAAVLLRGPANLCYSLFLGQGRIAHWALPEVVRQWGSVAFALPCFLLGGLRGAAIGYLVSETIIFTIGLAGARRSLTRSALRLDLRAVAPHLRVGLVFYAAELAASAFERSGAVLVRGVTHDYAQVGLFGVSYQIFTAAVLSSTQLSTSFVPLITVLRAKGEHAELKVWIERLVKWLAVVATLGLLGSVILGKDVVPVVLGRAYASVFRNVVVLSATLLFLPLTHVCSMLALTHDRPRVLIQATAVRLLCFWGLGVPLVSRWGSLGACVAVLFATGAQAVTLLWKSRSLVGTALSRWAVVVGAGLAFAPLAYLRASPALNVVLYAAAAAGYLFALRALGTISARELRALFQALGFAKARKQKVAEAGP
jgi:Membrane protein involved in the export of O-antigen and teichoic acid